MGCFLSLSLSLFPPSKFLLLRLKPTNKEWPWETPGLHPQTTGLCSLSLSLPLSVWPQAHYNPGLVNYKPLFFQSLPIVITEEHHAIIIRTTRSGPTTILVTVSLKPAQNKRVLCYLYCRLLFQTFKDLSSLSFSSVKCSAVCKPGNKVGLI